MSQNLKTICLLNLFTFITFMKLVASEDKIKTTLLKIAREFLVNKSQNSFKILLKAKVRSSAILS